MRKITPVGTWASSVNGTAAVGVNAVDQTSVRSSNLSLVLSEIFAAGGGLSRADIAARTGLTRATVSRLVKDLLDAGLVEEEAPNGLHKQGRPSTPLFPSSRVVVGIGLEVNVDHMQGMAIDLSGEVIDSFAVEGDFARSDPRQVLAELGEHANKLIGSLREQGIAELAGVVLGIPGIVDAPSGTVIYAPNLNWRDVEPFGLMNIEGIEGCPVSTYNDADLQAVCAAIELEADGIAPSSFIYLSVDTGIGGAIFVDGSKMTGQCGWAGEIGHMSVDPEGPLCHCGARGCLETYAGWRSMAAASGINWRLGPTEMARRLEAGDVKAHEAIESAGRAFGIALANAIKLLDILTVVLGNAAQPIAKWLMPALRKELDSRLLVVKPEEIQVLVVRQPGHLAARGAALSAIQDRLANPDSSGVRLN
ncbi:MAG: ROK family transcriptional regulator [Scrofimicrobium sp.]